MLATVLGDAKGHEIDVHVIVLDGQGNGIYGPVENGEMYPVTSLIGRGTINGQTIKFGIELPEEYQRFKKY